MKRLLSLCLIVFIALNVASCGNRREKHTSPNGENTIIVEYDAVSRPHVIFKGDVIWKYEGSGFNEEAYFDVKWINEDTVKLIYNDESHQGKYYEEFEIDIE